MDAIADPNFKHQTSKINATEESPSLLTVIIDITPQLWTEFDGKTGKKGNILDVLRSLIVFLNAHLAFNISNQVAVIAAHSQGIKYLYPKNSSNTESNGSDNNYDKKVMIFQL